jgi:hypothetical protein
MFLKIMDGDDVPDDTHGKGFVIVSNIIEAKYRYVRPKSDGGLLQDPEYFVDVVYAHPNRGLMTETFTIHGNAFLMNEYGRTIQTFYAKPNNTASK